MGLLFPIGTKSRPCRSLCGIAGGNVLNPERGVLSLDVQEHDQAVLDRGKARTGASAMKWEHKVEFFVLAPLFMPVVGQSGSLARSTISEMWRFPLHAPMYL
jgi:hypothetical protein